ncbi:hypothetical protein [Bradyrhizobium sp. LB14.3]|uniref:hypothetical protein n=1 Tax=Bradyrhizobium sp. LB14.3 TaxID=3156328 RepID=UPI0033913ED0
MLVLMLGMVLVLVEGMMMPVMMPLTMIVGMPMSSSIMRITIMVPPMIGAGYAGPQSFDPDC